MKPLLRQIKDCTLCSEHLPLGPNPVVRASSHSRLIVIGQAPGTRVHNTGIPWNDPSGNELRRWLQFDEETFYDEKKVALTPMGFCYPGKGKSGDLPPRPECAPKWHPKLLEAMPKQKLILLIGQYAQAYYLGSQRKRNLTETVRAFDEYLPTYFPLPHPSPRNRLWMKKNSWFEEDVLPRLRQEVQQVGL